MVFVSHGHADHFSPAVRGWATKHAGDHARWADQVDSAFMAEIQWLKDAGQPVDVRWATPQG